mmetsp:Transcript_15023/g.43391  ORF Transcript_15023/g.43391 Transcript_15023/m.43391 type:complete len:216 (+) Transcript_15023:361-1008(+)
MVPHLLISEHAQRVTARTGLRVAPPMTFDRLRLSLLRRSRRRMVVLRMRRGHLAMWVRRVRCRLSGMMGVVVPVPRVRRVLIVLMRMCRIVRVAAIWTRYDGTSATGHGRGIVGVSTLGERRSRRTRRANAVEGALLRDRAGSSDCSLASSRYGGPDRINRYRGRSLSRLKLPQALLFNTASTANARLFRGVAGLGVLPRSVCGSLLVAGGLRSG